MKVARLPSPTFNITSSISNSHSSLTVSSSSNMHSIFQKIPDIQCKNRKEGNRRGKKSPIEKNSKT